MTTEQANALKSGDVIYVSSWFVGSPPSVRKTTFHSLSRIVLATSKGDPYHYEIADHSLRTAARLHFTEAEARQDISNLIRERITKMESLLQEWETALKSGHA